jgi:hypothetical protein
MRYGIFLKLLLMRLFFRDIPQGSECSITYIELDRDWETRRSMLSEFYHFVCSCSRCTSQDENSHEISKYFCSVKKCSGLVGLEGTEEKLRKCNGCDLVYPAFEEN